MVVIYKHYKGEFYDYLGETIPFIPSSGELQEYEHMFHAAATEEDFTFYIYRKEGKLYAAHPVPLTIYIDRYSKIWARPAAMFHGYLENGTKRFTFMGHELE